MDAKAQGQSIGSGRMRKVVFGLIAAQIVLLGVVAVGWMRREGGASPSLERLDTGVPPGTPLTIESGYDGALRRAQEWEADATLFSAGMQTDWPVEATAASSSEIPGGGWLLYTFASNKRGVGPEGKAATLSMLVDRMSGLVIDEREMGWTSRPEREPLLTTYPISSVVALFAAETTIGNGYRTACPEFRHLSRVSIVPPIDGRGAYWLATYEDQRAAGQPAFSVKVDAETGDVERDDVVVDTGGCSAAMTR